MMETNLKLLHELLANALVLLENATRNSGSMGQVFLRLRTPEQDEFTELSAVDNVDCLRNRSGKTRMRQDDDNATPGHT